MNDHVERAISHAANQLHRPGTVEDALEGIVRSAAEAMPHFDHVGVSTLEDDGAAHTRASTSVLVLDLDDLQERTGEGPLIDSRDDTAVVSAPHIEHDDRWLDYIPAAVDLGLRSQLSVRLHLADRGTVGGLNLYSTTTSQIEAHDVSIASYFAAHASAALGRAQEHAMNTSAVAEAHLVGQAIGVLMERHRMNHRDAHTLLWRAAKHATSTVPVMAAALVGEVNARVDT